MKTLTIDAEWIWAILEGHKRYENRNWATNFVGPIALHAGLNTSHTEKNLRELAKASIRDPDLDKIADMRGKICGVVQLQRVFLYEDPGPWHDDPLAWGPLCFELLRPTWLGKLREARGNLGLWEWHLPILIENQEPALWEALKQSTPSSNLSST